MTNQDLHYGNLALSGVTDTHVHVFEPARFAYSSDRTYTPSAATVAQLQALHGALRVERVVLVQPSVYGTDNACLLDALSRIGLERCRGIAVADPALLSRETLLQWHAAGVRGLRLNLEVRHVTDAAALVGQVEQAAHRIEPPGWCLQLHCAAALLPAVAASQSRVAQPLVLDHFAGLRPDHAVSGSPELRTLLRLLDTGRVYVKLSAFYRASGQQPHHADLAPLVRELIACRPDRLLWGSDWPHTGGGTDRDPRRIEPFRSVDLPASLAALQSWCPDASVLRQILVQNPAELYGFDLAPSAPSHRGFE